MLTIFDYIKSKKLEVSDKEVDEYLSSIKYQQINKSAKELKTCRESVKRLLLLRKVNGALNEEALDSFSSKTHVARSKVDKLCDWVFERYFAARVVDYVGRIFEPIAAKNKLEVLTTKKEKKSPISFREWYLALSEAQESKKSVAKRALALKSLLDDMKRSGRKVPKKEVDSFVREIKTLESIAKKNKNAKKKKNSSKK